MKHTHIDDFTRGWFIGDFDPSLHKTTDFEVATKSYAAGDKEAKHYHKIAKEFTIFIEGSARMAGQLCKKGDIIVLEPGEPADFHALEPTTVFVVKIPSVKGDKYDCE